MRSPYLLSLMSLLTACTTPVPSGVTAPTSLDAPLEFSYDEDVDSGVLDGLSLVHDGISESGHVEADGKIARFFPDHGWFAGATYAATLDGLEPWQFPAPARWHLVGETSDVCGRDTWDPLVASTIDNTILVLAVGDGATCLIQRRDGAYTSRSLGTKATDTISRGTLHVSDDGSGFVVHQVDTKIELVDLAGGAPLVLGNKDIRTAGALSQANAHGLVVRGTDQFGPDPSRLVARNIERGSSPGTPLVVGPEVELMHGSEMMEVSAAASDAGVRAVGFIRWDATPTAHLHVAIARDGKTWTTNEIGSGDPNALRNIQVAVDEDGWVYVTWHQTHAGGEQMWSAAFGTNNRTTAPARIDGGAVVASRRDERLVSRWGHTAFAWLESAQENQLGKVAVRVAHDGTWANVEYSTGDVEPYVDLDMAVDPMGNLGFNWKNGNLKPCAARKAGAAWSEDCQLPAPGFTAPIGSVSMNARGRAYVSVFTGDSIEIAAFD
jgi:hypothetical protein